MSGRRKIITAIGVLLLLGAAGAWLFRGRIMQQVGFRPPTGAPGIAAVQVPDGFAVGIFAEGLDGPRFMTVGPDGTLFVAERGADRVVALPDVDGDARADEVVVVAEGLDNPSTLAFRPGTTELYVGEMSRVSRLRLEGLRAGSRETVVADLPERRIHTTTTVLFGADGRLYVSRGSSCNVCDEEDPRLAAVWVYDADGGAGAPFTAGLRNAVGLALNPATGAIWASNNGRDLLGNDLPPETVYILEEGADAGWPRCHAGTLSDPEYGGPSACDGVLPPVVTMQAHSAPLGLAFYSGERFPAPYRDDLFIAYHGSWNRAPATGYKVVRVPIEAGAVAGEPMDFATGWLQADGDSPGRPVDVTTAADGALLISDDKGGFIYRVVAEE